MVNNPKGEIGQTLILKMGEIMAPAKEMTIQRISEMSEHDYKKKLQSMFKTLRNQPNL